MLYAFGGVYGHDLHEPTNKKKQKITVIIMKCEHTQYILRKRLDNLL